MVILSRGTSRTGDMVKVKNGEESVLKRAPSIITIGNKIADSGAKSANRRSTSCTHELHVQLRSCSVLEKYTL